MSNSIKLYADFIAEQAEKTGNLHEANDTPDYHKAQFEKHAKLARGHQSASNSIDSEEDEDLLAHHEKKFDHHYNKAQQHATAYHKMTGKKLQHPPIDDQNDYVDYDHVKAAKPGSAPHDDDQDYLPRKHQTASHKDPDYWDNH